MQILFIIGNGFDLNLKMKTQFSDFCEFYQGIETEQKILKSLKKDIKRNIETWADLEKRLGEYTKRIGTYKSFEIIFDDIILNMVKYLQGIEDNVDYSSVNREKLFEYFSNPEISLPRKDIDEIRLFKSKWFNDHWYVDIMNFNYTKTIERLFDGSLNNLIIGNHHRPEVKIIMRDLYHIHGLLDDGTILGVNDLSQLKNEKFHNDQRIVSSIIKPENNKLQRKSIDDYCIGKISRSNLICIFGSSLGSTDSFWWEKIGSQLLTSKECELIIYTKGEEIPASLGHKKAQISFLTRELFLERTKLSNKEKEKVRSKIHVGANTNMFQGILKK